MNRTIIGVVAAVVLATAGTVFLVGYVRGAEARALEGQQTVDVLVLREDVARGTSIDELDGRVATETIPAKVRANGSVTSLADLAGQVAVVDLLAGEQVTASRFAAPSALEEQRAVDVPDGLQEITISLAPQRALGGQVAPGDVVGLYASFDLRDERDEDELARETEAERRQRLAETSKVILHKLLVTNVQLERIPQSTDPAEPGTAPQLAPTGNLLVTLAVDVPQAERIVFSSEYGAIWLTAQDDDTVEDGSRIRTARNIYDD